MLLLCFVSWWGGCSWRNHRRQLILIPVAAVIKSVGIDPLHFIVFLVTAL